MEPWKNRWGLDQWAAYFENQRLPVLRRSKLAIAQIAASEGELLSPKDLCDLVLQDPLLCLALLRAAERRKSHRLDHETTTALAAILQLGVDEVRKLLATSPEIEPGSGGLLHVATRARLAAEIARAWAVDRQDINPEEIAVAALLGGTGDLLLWVYAPEVAQKADDELASGRAERSAQAQKQACGFTFKELTLQCAERWKLPALLVNLLRGAQSERAQLTRVCANAARHLIDRSPTATLALASDLVDAARLIPNATLEWLAERLPGLADERRPALLAVAAGLAAPRDNNL
jgi:HD-like signal output (HDOD) protein